MWNAIKFGFGAAMGIELFKITKGIVNYSSETFYNEFTKRLKAKYSDDETVMHFVNKYTSSRSENEEKDIVVTGFRVN